MRLKVYYWDGTTDEADVGAAAQIALEEEFDILFTDAFDTGKGKATKGRLKYLYFLAWAALRAMGREVPEDWHEWAKGVQDAGFALDQDGQPQAADKTNPTKRGRSRAGSSS